VLVLEDGSVYEGYTFGADVRGYGEVIFNTSMTGYQEMLTDPSYAGQIIVSTYPLIGNYGINDQDFESKCIRVNGFVVRENCPQPSHWQSNSTLDEFLARNGVPCISGIDTRALTKHLRSAGVMMGAISSDETADEVLERLKSLPRYGNIDFVRKVTTDAPYQWNQSQGENQSSQYQIVVIDCGLKYNILRILRDMGCMVTAMPCTTPPNDILSLNPDGILLSPGPGDPALLEYLSGTIKALIGQKPIMGICLGHQLIGRAFGGKTFKLKFGHHGSNHPVQDLATGQVYITAQNHGYAVDADTIGEGLEVSHINLNDNTVEGFIHHNLPILSIQYHSEASPGPQDNVYLFQNFLAHVSKYKNTKYR